MRLLVVGMCSLAAASLAGASPSATTSPRALLTYAISYRPLGDTRGSIGRICVANADGSDALAVLSKGDFRQPVWSPGGRYLAYTRQTRARERARGAQVFEIFLASARGRIIRNLSRGWAVFNLGPAWSPDGRSIAFYGAWRGSAVAAVPRKGGRRRLLVDGASSPTWTPDGTRIAFTDSVGISSIRPNGSDRRLVLADAGQPAFSGDGSELAFVRRTGRTEFDTDVFVANADGSDARRLTDSAETEWDPTWSPDGGLIAFTRWDLHTDRYTVVVVQSDTGDEYSVIQGPHSAFDPSWRAPVDLPRAKRPACR